MFIACSIALPELKNCVSSFRSCTFAEGLILEAKFGSIELDFSSYSPKVTTCSLTVRRNSGNGELLVMTNSPFDKQILSKSGQSFNIALDASKKVKIARPMTSVGSIEILSVGLYTDDYQGEEMTVSKWKNVLGKCKSHKCLKITHDRLFASEGAQIETDAAIIISTNPPNMFKLVNGFIKFLGNCEITEMHIGGNIHKSEHVFPQHMGPPAASVLTQADIPMSEALPNLNLIAEASLSLKPAEKMPDEISSNILYDAPAGILFKLPNIKDTTFNNKAIIMDCEGGLAIPLPSIKPNSSYTVIIEMSRVNGNGKLRSYIAPGSLLEAQQIFVSQTHQSVSINVKSGPNPDLTGVYKVIIERPESSTGSIAIIRAIVINDNISANSYLKKIIAQKNVPQFSGPPSKTIVISNSNEASVKVEEVSRKFARLKADDYICTTYESVSGTVLPISTSSKHWVKKILPLFPNLKVSKFDLNISGIEKTNDVPNFVMCDINNVVPHSRIYLDEWPAQMLLPRESIDILKKAQVIFTPSNLNMLALREHLPGVTISRASKFWPVPTVQITKLDGFIYFEKDRRLTVELLNAWTAELGKLYIVGTRGLELPPFAYYISEYENYQTLFSHMLGCWGLIDLSFNQSYHSGILNTAIISRINIITNNIQFTLKNNEHVSYFSGLDRQHLYDSMVRFKTQTRPNSPVILANANEYVKGMIEGMVA